MEQEKKYKMAIYDNNSKQKISKPYIVNAYSIEQASEMVWDLFIMDCYTDVDKGETKC